MAQRVKQERRTISDRIRALQRTELQNKQRQIPSLHLSPTETMKQELLVQFGLPACFQGCVEGLFRTSPLGDVQKFITLSQYYVLPDDVMVGRVIPQFIKFIESQFQEPALQYHTIKALTSINPDSQNQAQAVIDNQVIPILSKYFNSMPEELMVVVMQVCCHK